jgi:transposase
MMLWTDQRDRAIQLAKTPDAVQVAGDRARVVSFSTPGKTYTVAQADGAWLCDCNFYLATGLSCGHIAAARWFMLQHPAQERADLTGATAQAHYDAAQTQEVALFDALLSDLCAGIEEPEQRMGRPRLPLRDQVFVAVQKTYSGLSSRRARSLFVNAEDRGQVERAPSFIAPSRFLNREDATPILHDLITKSALPLAHLESHFAQDSTGFRTTSFNAYCQEKHGGKKHNVWLKAHALVGTKTHVVAEVKITDSTGEGTGDPTHFAPLIRSASEAGFRIMEVSADKAYSTKANLWAAKEIGATPLIPFKGGKSTPNGTSAMHNATGLPGSGALWRKAYHYFQANREEFDARYHKRSNVEAVFSAIKRKLGETLRSKNRVAQENELLCKVLAYNLTVLIHQSFENGIDLGVLKQKSAREGL